MGHVGIGAVLGGMGEGRMRACRCAAERGTGRTLVGTHPGCEGVPS